MPMVSGRAVLMAVLVLCKAAAEDIAGTPSGRDPGKSGAVLLHG